MNETNNDKEVLKRRSEVVQVVESRVENDLGLQKRYDQSGYP